MPSFTRIFLFGAFAGQALGTVHHLFCGVFPRADIYAIEFDDANNTLTLVETIVPTGNSSKWIALDERKQNLYIANELNYDSYTITNSTSLEYSSSVTMSSNCTNANFIVASTASPWTVFGAPFSTGCPGNMISVDSTGSLQEITANIEYTSEAGVHGMALSPDNKFVYSADDSGNAVWVHSINAEFDGVVEVQYLPAPAGADPRHMAVHPKGLFAYVVFEASSEIGVYSRDNTTGKLTYTNTTYPLLPTGYTNATASYWADEVVFSVSATGSPLYMYASTRSRTSTIPGYVSAFSINGETGEIISQLFLTETTNSGGSANAVTAAPFAENYFAITDSISNHLEIWQISFTDVNTGSGQVVAHLDLSGGPSVAVWLD